MFGSVELGVVLQSGRNRILAGEQPGQPGDFDVLWLDGEDLRPGPYLRRRRLLEGLLADVPPPLAVTEMTEDPSVAMPWFRDWVRVGVEGLL